MTLDSIRHVRFQHTQRIIRERNRNVAPPIALLVNDRYNSVILSGAAGREANGGGVDGKLAGGYGISSNFPVVFRPSRSRCALAASASGYVCSIRSLSLPSAIIWNKALARSRSSSVVAM
jgi:hypothetical protein